MSSTKPTILLIHGSFTSAPAWSEFQDSLHSYGYETVAPQNPTTGGLDTPLKTSTPEDISNAQSALQKLVSEGKDVVVVAHSYGGVIGSSIVEGFDKKENASGGGVLAAVFPGAYLLNKGTSPFDAMQAAGGLPTTMAPHPSNPAFLHALDDHSFQYHDVPKSTAQPIMDHYQPQLSTVFMGKAESNAWEHVPCTYILMENDQALPVPVCEAMLQGAQAGAKYPWKTHRLESSHTAWKLKAHPKHEEVVSIVRRAAGEQV